MIGSASQRRVAVSFLDQVVYSGSNFATGVVVARLSGPGPFGEYMLAFTIWVVVAGFHRSLITEPLIVSTGDAEVPRSTLSSGLSAEILLAVAVSGLVAAVGLVTIALGGSFGSAILALSPWLAPLLVQDYWRGMAFQRRRPGLALANDCLFATVQACAILVFVLMGLRTAGYIIAGWGIGAAAGALLGLLWFRSAPRLGEGWRLVRQMWPFSRWTVADFGTGFAADQAYIALVAALLPVADYGGFRAAASFMGPTIVMLHAGSNIGLPDASRRAHSPESSLRAFARRLTIGAVVCVGLYGAAVAGTSERLLRVVYGDEFARFSPLVALASLQYVIAVLVFGQGIALKAAGRMRLLWRARAVVAVASITSMIVLVSWLGTIGAGWAGVVTGTAFAIGVYTVYRLEFGREADDGEAGSDTSLIPPEKSPLLMRPEKGML